MSRWWGKTRRGASKADGKADFAKDIRGLVWHDSFLAGPRQRAGTSEPHRPISVNIFICLIASTVFFYFTSHIIGMLRRYATVASRPPSRLGARGKSPVSLDHVSSSSVCLWHDEYHAEKHAVHTATASIVLMEGHCAQHCQHS
jgi:hypothetical protein